jgi:alkanesulfonate monooxygenase
MRVLWFFPTNRDVRYLGSEIGSRPMTPEYLQQLALAVDNLGYTGALIPTGHACENAWVVN